MRSPTSQHSPFLPPVALSHGEHGTAESHELNHVCTFPVALSDMRRRGAFFFD